MDAGLTASYHLGQGARTGQVVRAMEDKGGTVPVLRGVFIAVVVGCVFPLPRVNGLVADTSVEWRIDLHVLLHPSLHKRRNHRPPHAIWHRRDPERIVVRRRGCRRVFARLLGQANELSHRDRTGVSVSPHTRRHHPGHLRQGHREQGGWSGIRHRLHPPMVPVDHVFLPRYVQPLTGASKLTGSGQYATGGDLLCRAPASRLCYRQRVLNGRRIRDSILGPADVSKDARLDLDLLRGLYGIRVHCDLPNVPGDQRGMSIDRLKKRAS